MKLQPPKGVLEVYYGVLSSSTGKERLPTLICPCQGIASIWKKDNMIKWVNERWNEGETSEQLAIFYFFFIVSQIVIVSSCLAKTQVLVQIGPNGYLNRLAQLWANRIESSRICPDSRQIELFLVRFDSTKSNNPGFDSIRFDRSPNSSIIELQSLTMAQWLLVYINSASSNCVFMSFCIKHRGRISWDVMTIDY